MHCYTMAARETAYYDGYMTLIAVSTTEEHTCER